MKSAGFPGQLIMSAGVPVGQERKLGEDGAVAVDPGGVDGVERALDGKERIVFTEGDYTTTVITILKYTTIPCRGSRATGGTPCKGSRCCRPSLQPRSRR